MRSESVVVLLLACFASLASAQTVSNVLKVETVTTSTFSKGGTTSASSARTKVRYITPDGTVRTESIDPENGKSVEISNESKDYQILFNEKNRTASYLTGLFHGSGGAKGTTTTLGKSIVSGYSCEGFANSFPDGAVLKHWRCEDPKSGLRFIGRMELSRRASKVEESLTQVTANLALPSSFFEVPAGYTTSTVHGGGSITRIENGPMMPMQH